jgi:hypothetical protein
MAELVYSGDCPYCRAIARGVETIDRRDTIETVPIENERGTELVTDHHGGYVHAPHLFTSELVYYGIVPTAKGTVKELAKEYLPAL